MTQPDSRPDLVTSRLSRLHLPAAGLTGLLLVTLALLLATPPVSSQNASQSAPRGAPQSPEAGEKTLADKTSRDFDNSCMRSGCHGELDDTAFVHGPVAVGACELCHVATGKVEDHKFEPTRPLEKSCAHCHAWPKSDGSVHEAFAKGECTSCHDPHGGQVRALLVSENEQELCRKCHDPTKNEDGTPAPPPAPNSFLALHADLGKEGCQSCHDPHQSVHHRLLTRQEEGACLECHDSPITRPEGPEIQSMSATLADGRFRHTPIDQGECSGCHGSHGSESESLLIAAYSREFYVDFTQNADTFALCFKCHEAELVTAPETRLTGFRDGDRNLHAVHVNRVKGRSCNVCHDPHATDLPGLIRETVPFGPQAWPLPIGLVKTENGGTCTSGCHKVLSYDRGQDA